jgi:hypothetical protein
VSPRRFLSLALRAPSIIYNHIPNGWILREILLWLIVLPISLLTTPVQLARSLWASRGLLDGQWGRYGGFDFPAAANKMFHRTLAAILWKHGFRGTSPVSGVKLAGWFQLSPSSLYPYVLAPTIIPLLGMFIWISVHFLWVDKIEFEFVIAVLIVVVAGTSFYCNTFFFQNYNVLGWMLLPAVLFGWTHGNFALAALALLGMAATSLTATVFACAMGMSALLSGTSPTLLLSALPAMAVIGLKLVRARITDPEALLTIAKSIGMIRVRTWRYARVSMAKSQLWFWHLLIWQGVFIVAFRSLTEDMPPFALAVFCLYVVNGFARFADPESFLMGGLTGALADVLSAGNPYLLIPLFVLACPAPRMIGMQSRVGPLGILPVARPYDVEPILEAMRAFLAPITPGNRAFIAFPDPQGIYERIFDDQINLLQFSAYIALERGVLILPDYQTVIYDQTGEHMWGCDPATVLTNGRAWSASHVIVSTSVPGDLDPHWVGAGFSPVGRFSWAETVGEEDIRRTVGTDRIPTWWLLEMPTPR